MEKGSSACRPHSPTVTDQDTKRPGKKSHRVRHGGWEVAWAGAGRRGGGRGGGGCWMEAQQQHLQTEWAAEPPGVLCTSLALHPPPPPRASVSPPIHTGTWEDPSASARGVGITFPSKPISWGRQAKTRNRIGRKGSKASGKWHPEQRSANSQKTPRMQSYFGCTRGSTVMGTTNEKPIFSDRGS